ncbi:hypothetical protein N7922_05915 [Kosakonia sp. ML.JS2a]|uniref:hypothetical protein n=1 Tax=Kosakonia sp. ML.JS2a TaxID=2980557 RepID=UPI0021DA7F7D|nr:hypothetical protein [Kosakonia sp. ML.JS2a]UXY12061.1 hypothetical protein N7922_05915 [Kosakonia sp. ML.JS2a]
MHTVDDENVNKLLQSIKAGPANNLAYESALEIALKWLAENENGILSLTAEQEKAIKEAVSH